MMIDPDKTTYIPFDNEAVDYDAILIVSFGGPEGMEDVIPFMENVLRGRNIPRERIIEVSEHYRMFDGVSPINEQNRRLIAALEKELNNHGPRLPIYFGNRNWHPLLPDTLRQMRDDGVQRALAFFTSMYSCWSGCRQYRENIFNAQREVGDDAPIVDKMRMAYNHPLYIEANADRLQEAWQEISDERKSEARLVFTAHSIPMAMANQSAYVAQLEETCRLIGDMLGLEDWELVYQSRSGPPHQPWLEPDIVDHLEALNDEGVKDVVVMPIGFISDHMEVMYDLDTEAQQATQEWGMNMVRAGTVGTHPKFIEMIRELIVERMSADPERRAIGLRPANHDTCPPDCCLPR
jgi:ferrochelatase